MNPISILSVFLTVAIFSCQPPSSKPDMTAVSKDTLAKGNQQNDTGQKSNNNEVTTSECTRGKAEPVVKKSVFPNSSFQLQSDSMTGIETVDLGSDERLIIKNWGCEYYCLSFRFETSRFHSDTSDLKFWFEKAIVLIGELKNGVEAPVGIVVEAMKKYYNSHAPGGNKNLKLSDEIDCNDNEIREFVTLDRVEEMSNNRYAVEITYSVGPL